MLSVEGCVGRALHATVLYVVVAREAAAGHSAPSGVLPAELSHWHAREAERAQCEAFIALVADHTLPSIPVVPFLALAAHSLADLMQSCPADAGHSVELTVLRTGRHSLVHLRALAILHEVALHALALLAVPVAVGRTGRDDLAGAEQELVAGSADALLLGGVVVLVGCAGGDGVADAVAGGVSGVAGEALAGEAVVDFVGFAGLAGGVHHVVSAVADAQSVVVIAMRSTSWVHQALPILQPEAHVAEAAVGGWVEGAVGRTIQPFYATAVVQDGLRIQTETAAVEGGVVLLRPAGSNTLPVSEDVVGGTGAELRGGVVDLSEGTGGALPADEVEAGLASTLLRVFVNGRVLPAPQTVARNQSVPFLADAPPLHDRVVAVGIRALGDAQQQRTVEDFPRPALAALPVDEEVAGEALTFARDGVVDFVLQAVAHAFAGGGVEEVVPRADEAAAVHQVKVGGAHAALGLGVVDLVLVGALVQTGLGGSFVVLGNVADSADALDGVVAALAETFLLGLVEDLVQTAGKLAETAEGVVELAIGAESALAVDEEEAGSADAAAVDVDLVCRAERIAGVLVGLVELVALAAETGLRGRVVDGIGRTCAASVGDVVGSLHAFALSSYDIVDLVDE